MSSGVVSRVLTVAEMQARDLGRRRAAMTLFILLPPLFYYSTPADTDYGVLAGMIGVSWAIAAGGMFAGQGWRGVEPRLRLAGARPIHGLLGRLVILYAVAVVVLTLFTPQILARSTAVLDRGALIVAMLLTGVVSVPIGLAIGAVAPREVEATLTLVLVVGVGTSLPTDSPIAAGLPMYGPLQAVEASIGLRDGVPASSIVHAAVAAVILGVVAHLAWVRRGRRA